MVSLKAMEELRTKEEVINYFKQQGTNITEEEIENLKQNYDQTQKNNNALTMQQLDKVAGGGPGIIRIGAKTGILPGKHEFYTIELLDGKLKISDIIADPHNLVSDYDFLLKSCSFQPVLIDEIHIIDKIDLKITLYPTTESTKEDVSKRIDNPNYNFEIANDKEGKTILIFRHIQLKGTAEFDRVHQKIIEPIRGLAFDFPFLDKSMRGSFEKVFDKYLELTEVVK